MQKSSKKEPDERPGTGPLLETFERVLALFEGVHARLGELESSVSALQRRSATMEAAVQTDPVEEQFVPGVGLGLCVVRPRWNGSGLPPSQPSVRRAQSSSSLEVNYSEFAPPVPGSSPAIPPRPPSAPARRRHPSTASTLPPSTEDEEPVTPRRRSQRVWRRRTPTPPQRPTKPEPSLPLPPVEDERDSGWEPRPGDRRQPLGERERRRKMGLCIYCASNKHFLAECPVRPDLPDHVKDQVKTKVG